MVNAEKGETVSYAIEWGGGGALGRQGVTRETLKPGDHVIIVNAAKIKLTGEKLDKKVYRWHTLYPG